MAADAEDPGGLAQGRAFGSGSKRSTMPGFPRPGSPIRLLRRSLQLRVVTVTLALGAVMLSLVGGNLYNSIATGLLEDRTRVATAEALQLTAAVQAGFDATDKTSSTDALYAAAVTFVQGAAGPRGSRYVVLSRLGTTRSSVSVPPVLSGEVTDSQIPPELQAQVAADSRNQRIQVVSMRLIGEPEPVPSLIVGQQVVLPLAGGYGMYVVYPMLQERDSLEVVRRTLVYGGLALALLVAAVAYVVTRLVVAPVRRAAAIAERLASGRLAERMVVRGEDDLASLAKSFNAMAQGLQRQISQLEDLSRVQQRFVSDVSHELRTPLTTIRMAVDLLYAQRADFDADAGRSAELLHEQLARFEALLTDLLEISRFDAGAAVLDTEAGDLRRTVTRVVDDARALAYARGSRLTIHDPGAPCIAEYDPRRVERILRNLVINAIEHGEGRPIEILVGVNRTAVAVAVRDHGVGLRPGEAGLVFNRFWRADPARARTTGGTGLGLSIAMEDARLHSGWLQAWGSSAAGSVFRLTLPRVAGQLIDTSPVPLTPSDSALPDLALPDLAPSDLELPDLELDLERPDTERPDAEPPDTEPRGLSSSSVRDESAT